MFIFSCFSFNRFQFVSQAGSICLKHVSQSNKTNICHIPHICLGKNHTKCNIFIILFMCLLKLNGKAPSVSNILLLSTPLAKSTSLYAPSLHCPTFEQLIMQVYCTLVSRAKRGWERCIFLSFHIQICSRVIQGSFFQVTMYTVHISSNGSHFLTAGFLMY